MVRTAPLCLSVATVCICLGHRISGCAARPNQRLPFVPSSRVRKLQGTSDGATLEANPTWVREGKNKEKESDNKRTVIDTTVDNRTQWKHLLSQCFEGSMELHNDFIDVFYNAFSFALKSTVALGSFILALHLVAPYFAVSFVERDVLSFLIYISSFMERTIGSLQGYVLYLIIYVASQSIKASILCICLPFGIVVLAISALARQFQPSTPSTSTFLTAFQDILQRIYAATKQLYFVGTSGVNERAQDIMSNSLFLMQVWDKRSLSDIAGNQVLTALSVVLLAPLCEEMVFRGILGWSIFYVSSRINAFLSRLTDGWQQRQNLQPSAQQEQHALNKHTSSSFLSRITDGWQQRQNLEPQTQQTLDKHTSSWPPFHAFITSILFASSPISSWVYPLLSIKNIPDVDEQAKYLLLMIGMIVGIFQSLMAFYVSLRVFSPAMERHGLAGSIGAHSAWNVNVNYILPLRFVWRGLRGLGLAFQNPQENVITILTLVLMISMLLSLTAVTVLSNFWVVPE